MGWGWRSRSMAASMRRRRRSSRPPGRRSSWPGRPFSASPIAGRQFRPSAALLRRNWHEHGGMLKVNRLVLLAVALLIAATACRHGNRAPRPIRAAVDPELLKMSKEQTYQRGEDWFAK